MSISARFMETLRKRKNPLEIHYYMVRCEYNAMLAASRGEKDQTKKFIDQAKALSSLLVSCTRSKRSFDG